MLGKTPQVTVLEVKFYESSQGAEPVREWLKDFDTEIKKHIGTELKKIQMGWPVGPPLCKKFDDEFWEFRTALNGIIYRILFVFYGKGTIVLLHGFIKKTPKTSAKDKKIASDRFKDLKTR